MAVSRGKMLGHYVRAGVSYKCSCCQTPDATRWRKRVEARETEREIAEELSEDEAACRTG